MFNNASSRKEFILVNNTIPSYEIAFEQLLYYKMVANVNNSYYMQKQGIFHFNLSIVSHHASWKFSQ